MFHGHAVCWVLGETLEAARLGAAAGRGRATSRCPALLTVARGDRGRELPGRSAAERSAATSSRRLAAPPTSSSGEFEFAGQEHFYLETHAALAEVDEAARSSCSRSTQHPSETQEIVAHVLGLASHEVTVQCLRMGGGFGGKEMQPHGFAAIAALGATLTGRPVRVRLNRTQDMTMTGKRHGFHADWRVGFDDDGRLLALDATLTADGGWSLDLSEPVLARALCHVDNAYWIPHVRVNGRVAKTNKTSHTAFRGFGGPQGMLVIEDILGRCAPLLGIDPLELRRRNFYRAGQTHALRPAGPARRAARAVLGPGARRRRLRRRARGEIAEFNAAHAHVKRGAGDDAGQVRHLVQPDRVQPGRRARARLQGRLGADQPRRHRDGPGPAHEDAPGRGDDARRAAGAGAAGSDAHRQGAQHLGDRGVVRRRPQRRGGQERLRADPRAARAGRRRAARHQRRTTSASSTAWRGRGPSGTACRGRSSSARRTSSACSSSPPASTAPRDCTGTPRSCTGRPFKYFAYGVRRGRGRGRRLHRAYRTRRVDILHDVGDCLSPLVDLGQIEGGFVQGAGWLTLEELRWDTSDGPRPRAAARRRRPAPTSCRASPRCPRTSTSRCSSRRHEDGAVYGCKAVGEPPLMLAFSVREALRQAAAAFGPAGTASSWRARPRPRRCTGRSSRPGCPTRPRREGRRSRHPSPAGDRPVRVGESDAVACLTALVETVSPAGGAGARRAGDVDVRVVVTRRARPARRWSSRADATWGSIGGGNIEAVAIERARELLANPATTTPVTFTVDLSDKAPVRARRPVLRR